MAEAKKTNYGNESISSLKGADRVRKRPGVIFGSDGLDGCEHAVFEILSNSIDEAREGHGKLITVTRYLDHSIEVEDMGRGCPVDYNPKEKRFNWELVYCELYAGGKYNNLDGDNYEYSLGLNGLGACATQYSSRYMDVTVWRDGNKYSLHFERGEPVGKKGDELRIEPISTFPPTTMSKRCAVRPSSTRASRSASKTKSSPATLRRRTSSTKTASSTMSPRSRAKTP